jgi:hypothetical protein
MARCMASMAIIVYDMDGCCNLARIYIWVIEQPDDGKCHAEWNRTGFGTRRWPAVMARQHSPARCGFRNLHGMTLYAHA